MTSRHSGFVVLFTGLPGAGKSTLAAAVHEHLQRETGRSISRLDGDALRRELSSDLGYSRADRDEHVRRVGLLAADIAKTGGVALCSIIAPYDSARKATRRLIEPMTGFVLVHVATPLETCEARDPKGLYARARAGALPHFTGVSDPYETPDDADVTIDASAMTPDAGARLVIGHLRGLGLTSG